MKLEDPDELVISRYGKLVEIITQISYSTSSFPESLLPYSKEKIKEALVNEIEVMKLVIDSEVEGSTEKNIKYLSSLETCLFLLEESFVSDDIAIQVNKKLKEMLLNSKK